MDVDPNNDVADDIQETTSSEEFDDFGSAIFLLNNLPFENRDVHAHPHPLENNPEHPDYMPLLAATYFSPLQQILSSNLDAAGFVRDIYVNFGPKGYYKLDPLTTAFPATIQAFETMLGRLFQGLTILDPLYNIEPWRKFNDLPSLISDLPGGEDDPPDKIGCLYGDVTRNIYFEMETYMDDTSAFGDPEKFLLVVGRIVGEEIEAYIEDFVKVAEHDQCGDYCLQKIIVKMEDKWNI